MKILAVADVESRKYYDYYRPGSLDEFDLIISCGDLRRGYLEFLVTLARCPLVYVPGNHDEAYIEEPPEGCIPIDGRIKVIDGVRILGLGGSYAYRKGEFRYSEGQMSRRIWGLAPSIVINQGFDILVTHAPARGINDTDAPAHRGFSCFNTLIDRFKPRYFVHGHMHRNYGMNVPQLTEHGETTILNAFDHVVFEI